MQAGKSSMETAKEAAKNVVSSAKSGMEKTKAVAEEKVEKMMTRDPVKKAEAEQRMEERMDEAEAEKLAARERHAVERRDASGAGAGAGGAATAGGVVGYPTGQSGVAVRDPKHSGRSHGTGGGAGPVAFT